jgi:phenylalanyl-tRNA synthetase beta chain
MKISYNWLHSYLPEVIDIEKLSKILTAIGLEVEGVEEIYSHPNGLAGLVIGEVLTCEQHPNADKLKITTVNIGSDNPLQIVCGAANVAVKQKVVIATVGTTIYPTKGGPITMKVAKIRGVESYGMICAEDEIGLGESHDGILVLPEKVDAGITAAIHFNVTKDYVIEIGITANRIDAMSHLGVARDVCAWLSNTSNNNYKVKLPKMETQFATQAPCEVAIHINDETACQRYAGVVIQNLHIKPSPNWLQQHLKTIGVRPINNIVDITNYVLHETGQPLHAFDLSAITGNAIHVRLAKENALFTTLDDKERKLIANDIMIDNATESICIAGVFGGITSGVTNNTMAIFLESAWFNPSYIRKTSMHHGLRTDAAIRFEKQTDISMVPTALKRAITLIKEVCETATYSQITDVYPTPHEKKEIGLKHQYLKKVSGKHYHPDAVKKILQNLGFEIAREGIDEIKFLVPLHKTDISLPVDLVEEIMRIDGLDNIDIPTTMSIAIGSNTLGQHEKLKEKAASYVAGMGAHEIVTNSIVDSKLYDEVAKQQAVRMINNLSADLDVMRLHMRDSMLQVISYNVNRKQQDLFLYDFGNTYMVNASGNFIENNMLCIAVTGIKQQTWWQGNVLPWDLFGLKGVVESLLQALGLSVSYKIKDDIILQLISNDKNIGTLFTPNEAYLKTFDIKQPVYIAELNWGAIVSLVLSTAIRYKEVTKYPSVQRDLSMLIGAEINYAAIQTAIKKAQVQHVTQFNLFDLFVNEKLGAGKKSVAINFIFSNSEQTFTDNDIDKMMQKIITSLEKEVQAEIRK